MSLVVAWISIDNKSKGRNNISAVYFGADSRISWGKKEKTYDIGSKLVWTKNYPELFAFCGKVEFPMMALSNICSQIDSGMLFEANEDIETKQLKIEEALKVHKGCFRNFGKEESCQILYGTKCNGAFSIALFNVDTDGVTMEILPLPQVSGRVHSMGSGALEFENKLSHVILTNEENTSRGVFHCLWKTIEDTKEYTVGGLIQFVGLYRGKDKPQVFGILNDDKLYVTGNEVGEGVDLHQIEWRDVNFQRINPTEKQLLEGAQQQPFME